MRMLKVDDPARTCPCCDEKGGLSYDELPASKTCYTVSDGGDNDGDYTIHNAASRDYYCACCDGTFILFSWDRT